MSLSTQVSKSLVTLCEMMHDRGRDDLRNEISKFAGEPITTLVTTKSSFCIDIRNDLRVLYALASKFKVSDIKKYIDDVDFALIIVIVREKISSTNLKSLSEYDNIQVFELKELMVNISKHALVPKHELIGSDQEPIIQAIIAKHNVKSRFQLPIILKNDPMARYLNAKTGNIIKIVRYSPTSGEHIIYRCCM